MLELGTHTLTATMLAAWPLWRWPLAALLLVSGVRLAFVRLARGRAGERRVRHALDEVALDTLHDVLLPTPNGGLTQIDHLLLTPRAILVVETKNFAGALYGDAAMSHWRQRLGKRTRRFYSPLMQNDAQVRAVRHLVGPVPLVVGRVVFTGRGRFPQGAPPGVFSLEQLCHELRLVHPAGMPASGAFAAAWQTLRRNARRDRSSRRRHLRAIQRTHGRDLREFAGWLSMGAGLAIAALSLVWG